VADLDRSRLALYVALAVVVCVLGARYVGAQDGGGAAAVPVTADGEDGAGATGETAGEDGASGAVSLKADDGPVVVHVAGAVHRPGVYRLAAGARVEQAVQRAGGATRRADLTAVNLAAEAEDGRQIVVPERIAPGHGGGGAAGGSAGAPGGDPAAGGAAGSPPAVPIDLNRASAEELQQLDGIGPGLAGRILAYREEHNGFGDVEELADVPGIGPKRLAALRESVRV
jgi:competence protein ComEA